MDLEQMRRKGWPVWYQKIQDVATAGIPDILLCIRGHFGALELKSPGNPTPTKLQLLTLQRIREADGMTAVVKTWDEWVALRAKWMPEW